MPVIITQGLGQLAPRPLVILAGAVNPPLDVGSSSVLDTEAPKTQQSGNLKGENIDPAWLVWTENIFQVQILLLWLPSKERAH